MPLPRVSLPEPPTHLRELLDQAANTEETPFLRVMALAKLAVRIDQWFEEMAAFCHERGGTLGMDAATLRKLATEQEQHEPGSDHVLDIQGDQGPSFREATPAGSVDTDSSTSENQHES